MAEIPAVSLVIPLYNEQDNVRSLVATLTSALGAASLHYELLLVDNGSRDRTAELVDELAASNPRIRKVVVAENQGFGHGILTGLSEARGARVAFMCGDLQVDEHDVVKCFRTAIDGNHDLVKATRVRREDGPKRRFFSFALNALVPLLFRTRGRDVNGTPKVMTRELFQTLHLESKRWFIDAELMIKASALPGLSFSEVPVVFHPRREGKSAVRCLVASVEFLREMLFYRLSGLRQFRGAARAEAAAASTVLPS